jgi:hypothetical protein
MATRIAVLGLYRSGSSAAAGVLHHLGVEMGAPYWMDNYESARLARRLRRWWHEPDLHEHFPPAERVREIRRIADYVNLVPDDDRFAAALASIRPEGTPATVAPRAVEVP